VKLVLATHPEAGKIFFATNLIRYGSSPRGSQTLILWAGIFLRLLVRRFKTSHGKIYALSCCPRSTPSIILNSSRACGLAVRRRFADEIAGR